MELRIDPEFEHPMAPYTKDELDQIRAVNEALKQPGLSSYQRIEIAQRIEHIYAKYAKIRQRQGGMKRYQRPLKKCTQLYFIQAGHNGPIKIGISDSPSFRMKELQTGNPARLRLLCVVSTLGRQDEDQAKIDFVDGRLMGEWYQPTEKLMSFIREAQRRCSKIIH